MGPLNTAAHAAEALGAVIAGVEFREFAAVAPDHGRRHAGFALPALLETAQPPQHIARPADGLAVFAVVDDVEADLGLFAHHLGDAVMQACFEGWFVVRLSVALGGQKFSQARRPDQTADMGGRDAPPLAGERRGAALLRAGLRADFTGMTKFPPSRPAFLPGSHRPRPLAHDPEKLKPVFGQDHAQNNGLGRAAVHGNGVSLWDHAGCAVSILCTM
jgi:hypothetical protein